MCRAASGSDQIAIAITEFESVFIGTKFVLTLIDSQSRKSPHYFACVVRLPLLERTQRVRFLCLTVAYCFVSVPARTIPGSVISHLISLSLSVLTALKCKTLNPKTLGLIFNVAVPVQSAFAVYVPVNVNC